MRGRFIDRGETGIFPVRRRGLLFGLTSDRWNLEKGDDEMEQLVRQFQETRNYLRLGMVYTSDMEVRASRMAERCQTLKRESADPLEATSYEAVAELCRFIQEGYRLCLTQKVNANERLEEILDLYLKASGQVDPIVKFHLPLLHVKLKSCLERILRHQVEKTGSKDGAYDFFYQVVKKTINYIFFHDLVLPNTQVCA